MMEPTSKYSPWNAALIDQNRSWLMPYLHSLVGNRETAEDLTQEVFLTALRNQDKFDGKHALGAWLRGIARNTVHAYWRKAGKSPVLVEPETLEKLDETAAAREERCGNPEYETDRLKALRECMAGLTARLRSIFRLKYTNQLRVEAIASRVRMDVGAVNMALSRGRKALQTCIGTKLTELGYE